MVLSAPGGQLALVDLAREGGSAGGAQDEVAEAVAGGVALPAARAHRRQGRRQLADGDRSADAVKLGAAGHVLVMAQEASPAGDGGVRAAEQERGLALRSGRVMIASSSSAQCWPEWPASCFVSDWAPR
jgi:hypothetical protein